MRCVVRVGGRVGRSLPWLATLAVAATVLALGTAQPSKGARLDSCGLSGDTPVTSVGQPANDNFSSATQLSGASGTLLGTLTGATVENDSTPRESDPYDSDTLDGWSYGANPTRSVWYCWTAPEDGSFTFSTKGSPPPYQGDGNYTGDADPPLLVAWTGTDWGLGTDTDPNALTHETLSDADSTPVAWENKYEYHSDDGTAETWSEIRLNVTAGTQVALAVDNYPGNAPEEGNFRLTWSGGPSDRDEDGVPDATDNCVDTPNPAQSDAFPPPSGDGVGDACEGGVIVHNNSTHPLAAFDWVGCVGWPCNADPKYDCAAGATCVFPDMPSLIGAVAYYPSDLPLRDLFTGIGTSAGNFTYTSPTAHWHVAYDTTRYLDGAQYAGQCSVTYGEGYPPNFCLTSVPEVITAYDYTPTQEYPLRVYNGMPHHQLRTSDGSWVCAEGETCDAPVPGDFSFKLDPTETTESVQLQPQGFESDGSYLVFVTGGGDVPVTPPAAPEQRGPCSGLTGHHAYLCFKALQDVADPVNLATGAFTTDAVDASLPGGADRFSFVRSYTSDVSDSSELGPGWTDSYAERLTVAHDGSVTFADAQGAAGVFLPNGSGGFTAPSGSLVTLKTFGTGYEVDYPDGSYDRFDSSGRLTVLHDPNGNGVALTYGGDGLLASATDAGGRIVTFEHDSNGLLTKLTLPDDRAVSYAYTGGLLTSVTDLRGNATGYAYDAQGRLTSEVDQNGHTVVQNTYGADGRVTQQQDALGHVTTFEWAAGTTAGSGTATTTDARGNQWIDRYNGGLLAARTDSLGDKTQFEYDPKTLDLTAITDADGNRTDITYDGAHRPLTTKLSGAAAALVSNVYNSLGEPTQVTDGNGNATVDAYDASGNLLTTTRPDGSKLTHAYDSTGEQTSLTDARGFTTHFGYDAARDVTSVTQPSGATTSFEYDATGRVVSTVSPLGNVTGATADDHRTAFTYNAAGQITSTTDPLGKTTTVAYDPVGNLVRRTDADGHTTRYAYDAANHLVAVTAPDASQTTYEYDSVGNLVSRTDGNGHVTTFDYDGANRLVSMETPLGKQWTYQYDPDGNLITANAPSGGTTRYGYDALGRLISIDYSDGTPAVSYTYDNAGNRVAMTDGAGSVAYAYDALNRLKSATRGGQTTSYAYDANGDVVARSYPGATAIRYRYNRNGLLSSVTSDGHTTSYAYDVDGQLRRTTLPNGVIERRAYDSAGDVLNVRDLLGTAVLARNIYTYDPAGNPQTLQTLGAYAAYSYDADNRLTGVCYLAAGCAQSTDPKITYGYDAVGNRVSEARPSGTTTYAYDPGDELLSSSGPSGSTTYAYDANGDRTTAGASAYTYDLAGQLTSAVAGGQSTSYAYDGDGNRVASTAGGATTSMLWDSNFGLPQLVAERGPDGATERSYLYGLQRIAETTASGTDYYGYDALGSVVGLTDGSGTAVASYSYEPFGTDNTGVKGRAGQQRVQPVLDCVDSASGTPTAHFGYLNPNAYSVSLPVSGKNTFAPTPANRSQPTLFAPGTWHDVFTEGLPDTGSLSWTLNGTTVTADSSTPACGPAAAGNPMRFAGQYDDSSSGLYDLRARSYDPATSTFTSRDPLAPAAAAPYSSSYAYALDAPTALVDPSGMGPIHENTCGSIWCWIEQTNTGACIGGAALGLGFGLIAPESAPAIAFEVGHQCANGVALHQAGRVFGPGFEGLGHKADLANEVRKALERLGTPSEEQDIIVIVVEEWQASFVVLER